MPLLGILAVVLGVTVIGGVCLVKIVKAGLDGLGEGISGTSPEDYE